VIPNENENVREGFACVMPATANANDWDVRVRWQQ
jgi:hypothetical protein